MLTRGRAEQLVLKAAEPEGFEACLFYFRRYEPVSTVTTVSKLVDFLETTFSADLMDSLIFFKDESHPGNMKHLQISSKSESSSKVWREAVFGIICSSTLLARQN